MLFSLLALTVVVISTSLAVFVAARAWSYRPSRLFVYFAGSIIAVVGSTILRDTAASPEGAYYALVTLVVGVGAYIWLLMLLLSALFVPEWWEGSRPIIWISLPYALCTLFMAVDCYARLGIVVGAPYQAEIYRLTYLPPGSLILLTLSLIGQLFSFAIIAIGLIRAAYRHLRPVILLLGAAMTISLLLAVFAGQFNGLARAATLVQTLPILAALGYAIVGTQLFLPTRIALDMALQSLRDSVAVFDREGKVAFANPEAVRLGLRPGEQPVDGVAEMVAVLNGATAAPSAPRSLSFGERSIEIATTPVLDKAGRSRGVLLLGRDVTELRRRTAELEQEQRRLDVALRRVEEEQRERAQLADTVRSLALPLIPVLPGVIVVPLIGDFTAERIDDFISVLLRGVEREGADTVMLDITGISLLDTAGAQGLLSGVRAAALLGATCVLVGVRPEVAQSLVSLGIALDEVRSAQTLEQAVLERIRARR